MTEEKKERLKETLSYDYNLLAYAQIAQEYLASDKEEGIHIAKKSLELLLKEANISDPSLVNTVTDERVIPLTIKNQLDTYMKARNEDTLGELIEYHSKDLESYVNGGISRLKEDFKNSLGKNYGAIRKYKEKADYIIKGKEYGRSSDEEVEKAKRISNYCERIFSTIGLVDNKKLPAFRQRVKEELLKEAFNQLFPKKPEKEEPNYRMAA